MLWSVLKTIRENDGRTNDDQEKDVVPDKALTLVLRGCLVSSESLEVYSF